jgi:hypothetical protein
MIFASANLCHQANRSRISNWRDDFPRDEDIYFDAADKFGGLAALHQFKPSLERIGNKACPRG